MLVKEVMSKNILSVCPEEHVSKALGIMKKNRVHQLAVMENGRLYGLLELKNIVSHDFDAAGAKVSTFAINVPQVDANATLESAVQVLLNTGSRALPVTEGGNVVGVISETDLIKVAKHFVKGLNQTAKEIATPVEYLGKDDSFGKFKHMMLEKNISRVPIIDGGKVLGMIGALEMINLIEGKDKMAARGGHLQEQGAKEKITIDGTKASTFMRPAFVISGGMTVNNVIDFMKDKEDVLVETENVYGIITAKDIIELFASLPAKQLYVQITGMHDESIEFKVRMDIAVNEFVQKISKMVDKIEYLVVHVEKMRKQGPKEKYSIRARFKTPLDLFIAHSWGWKPVDVVQEVFRTLEREVINKYGHVRSQAKKRRYLSKRR